MLPVPSPSFHKLFPCRRRQGVLLVAPFSQPDMHPFSSITSRSACHWPPNRRPRAPPRVLQPFAQRPYISAQRVSHRMSKRFGDFGVCSFCGCWNPVTKCRSQYPITATFVCPSQHCPQLRWTVLFETRFALFDFLLEHAQRCPATAVPFRPSSPTYSVSAAEPESFSSGVFLSASANPWSPDPVIDDRTSE